MNALHLPILSAIVLLPALAGALVLRVRERESARTLALVAAALSLVLGIVAALAFRPGVGGYQLEEIAFRVPFLGMRWRLGIDGLSVVPLPLSGLVVFAIIAAGPRGDLDQRHMAGTLFTHAATLGVFCSLDLALLVLFWVLRLVPGAWLVTTAQDPAARKRLGRTYAMFIAGASLPLVIAVSMLGWLGLRAHAAAPFDLSDAIARGVPLAWQPAIFVLVTFAVAIRMAVAPLHAWLPELIERGPLGVGIILAGVHVAMFVLARVVIPLLPVASAEGMPLLATLALFSALYGAVVALVQRDLRRTVGFLAVSQSGMMMVGLASMNNQSVTGALLQDVASGAAISGLLLVIWALQSRTGSARVEDFGGLAQKSPRMAVCFFLFGFAAVGFPGSLNFISEDLLLHGVLDAHPVVATVMLFATVLNGITFLRMFGHVFLGPLPRHLRPGSGVPVEDLLPRERVVALALLTVLFVGGLVPTPLLMARRGAIDALFPRDAHVQMRTRGGIHLSEGAHQAH